MGFFIYIEKYAIITNPEMLKDNINSVIGRIAAACQKAGREPGSVTLIGVTKTVPAVTVSEAISLGIKDIGENKIQEAQVKFSLISAGNIEVRKHFIGHLQTNKAKKAVELFDLIQSVDSLRLATEINSCAAASGKVQDCLIEVKVSAENTKFGLAPEAVRDFIAQARNLSNIRLRGIMGMAPYFDDRENARPYFARLKSIFDSCKRDFESFEILSMGMSGDFESAIEEGSTMVRVGSAIFGERKY
ncbi:MAG: YggS family pyridoxal phosphate enzyme, partial [Nitrospirae bacterium RIFOXYC2_FULL_44_7]